MVYEKEIRDKFGLRDYLKTFDLTNTKTLESQADEIMDNVVRIMQPYADGDHRASLMDYYSHPYELIQKAYKEKDFNEQFPKAIDYLLVSIEWE